MNKIFFSSILLLSAQCLAQPSQTASAKEIADFYQATRAQLWSNLVKQSSPAMVETREGVIGNGNMTSNSTQDLPNPIEQAQLLQKSSSSNSGLIGDNGKVNCWDFAGKHYKVDPWLLFAYAKTESSFNPKAINYNKSSNTKDMGLMQINSIWLPSLSKYGISEVDLYDSCQSIFVGAYIVRNNFNRYGNGYHGLVAYNVGNPFSERTKISAQKYYANLVKNYNEVIKRYKEPMLRSSLR